MKQLVTLNILQRQIILLLCEGYLNKEVADILEVKLRKVQDQRMAIYQKLRVNNTAQLVQAAVVLKLVEL